MKAQYSLMLSLLVACGGSEKKDVDEPVTKPAWNVEDGDEDEHTAKAPDIGDDDGPDDGLAVEGLRGRLDPADIQRGVEPRSGDIAACFQSESKTKKFIGGSIVMSFKVGRDGAVKTVQISKGDLGAWEVESCLLAEARALIFPKPKGGDGVAEFTLPLDFPPRKSPIWLTEEQGEEQVADVIAELEECSPSPANVWVTVYVGVRGEVQAAGFASPSKTPIDDEWAACASEKIGAWTLADPRGKIAKLGFRYKPE